MTDPSTDPMGIAGSQAIGDIPRRSAARYPDKVALVHRDVRLTYAELDGAIDRFAAAMYRDGLRKGDRLALLSHNCWQYPVVVFAAARIGVVVVPINFMLTAPEVAYILADCRADALVAEDALVPTATLAEATADVTVRLHLSIPLSAPTQPAEDSAWTSISEWSATPSDPAPETVVADDDLIRIMYTSGTESRPKGAMHTSRSLMWQYMSCIITGGMTADDVEVHSLPLYHCAQLDNFLSTDIFLGATSIIVDRPDPAILLRTIAAEQATKLFCPPTVWISLLRSPDFTPNAMASLRKGYYGASALPAEVLREMTTVLPGLQLWNFYGQTEMASLATALGPEDQTTRGGSAGRPALNVQTRIVDENNEPVAAGTVGEIVHRSPQATVGYLNLPDKTAEAFRCGWFHSGDLGYLDDDGYLWVVDRQKDMIKTGGENVASREVEEVLFGITGVREAAVFAVPHPRWIEAIAAVIVPTPEAGLDENTVVAECRKLLAGYKVPKFVIFADDLPKNPSGKILKRDLRDRYSAIANAGHPTRP